MKIIMKAKAGSHLFGTNTPSSDTDFKGVYIPSKRDLFLQKAQGTIPNKRNKAAGEKNTSEDIDVELYSLQKFMNMLFEGQTVALELLWTPDEMIVEQSEMWRALTEIGRKQWMHKKVTSFVGYCKTQADKYGIKGSRMAAVKKVIEALGDRTDELSKLQLIWDQLQIDLKGIEHVSFGVQETMHGNIPYMEVCERKFQDNQKIRLARNNLQALYDSYGHRAKQAESNQGIDFKALSHAYRVCCQAIEILSEHKLTLPLKEEDLKIVRDVKLGLIPFKEFQPMLEEKLAEVLELEKTSTLSEGFDYKHWCEDFVFFMYEEFAE